ncbi:type II/IV secretion system protein, partial [Pseudomonas aeruginosa]
EQCLAIRRSEVRNQQLPLEFLAAQLVEYLKRPGRKLDLETLTQWLAEYAGQPYQRIDPLNIDVAAVTPLMSDAIAPRQ